MPVITALEKQKRRPRVDVHLDGNYAVSVFLDLAVERGLSVGLELSREEQRQLAAEDQRRGAIQAALRLLAILPRSEQDLRDRLRRRGFGQAAQDAAVTRMRELGYVDDKVFARFFVEARQSATPRSRRALAFELKRKGIDNEIAIETVAEVSDEDAAYDAAQRRLRMLRSLDRQTFMRRLGTFLASRGFSYGTSRSVIDRCWREMTDDSEPDDSST